MAVSQKRVDASNVSRRRMEENNNSRQDATAALFGFPATNRSKLEQTLCIVKPDAFGKVDEILDILKREGFAILQTRQMKLDEEEAAEFYEGITDSNLYSGAVTHLCSDQIMAVIVSGPGAIQHLNEVLGPETFKHRQQYPGCLRNRFGTKGSDVENALHGSASESDALKELYFFFPELTVEPRLADSLASYYVNDNILPVLTVGLSEFLKANPENPLTWFADWLSTNNPNKAAKQKAAKA